MKKEEREFIVRRVGELANRDISLLRGQSFFQDDTQQIRAYKYISKEDRPDNSGHVDFDIYAELIFFEKGENIPDELPSFTTKGFFAMDSDGEEYVVFETKEGGWLIFGITENGDSLIFKFKTFM
jgi:hypothetical protein